MDIASLILEPGTERRERKFSRQTLEQDNADIQRALRKKSRKVLRQNNHCIQNRGHPSKIYKGFKTLQVSRQGEWVVITDRAGVLTTQAGTQQIREKRVR